MTMRKPVRCRDGARDTWTRRCACARTVHAGRLAGSTWGRRAIHRCQLG